MMGANWQPDSINRVEEKFAIFPIRTTSNKLVWLKKYVVVTKYIDSELSHPIRSNHWKFIYTKNEYLMKLLNDKSY